jgi:hypothetical protein
MSPEKQGACDQEERIKLYRAKNIEADNKVIKAMLQKWQDGIANWKLDRQARLDPRSPSESTSGTSTRVGPFAKKDPWKKTRELAASQVSEITSLKRKISALESAANQSPSGSAASPVSLSQDAVHALEAEKGAVMDRLRAEMKISESNKRDYEKELHEVRDASNKKEADLKSRIRDLEREAKYKETIHNQSITIARQQGRMEGMAGPPILAIED